MRKLINEVRLQVRMPRKLRDDYKEYCEFLNKDMAEEVREFIKGRLKDWEDIKKQIGDK